MAQSHNAKSKYSSHRSLEVGLIIDDLCVKPSNINTFDTYWKFPSYVLYFKCRCILAWVESAYVQWVQYMSLFQSRKFGLSAALCAKK